MTAATTTYTATLPTGTVVTRKSARTYTHIVVAYRAEADKWSAEGWEVIGWAGRLDLAMKLASSTAQMRPAVGYTMKGCHRNARVARVVRDGALIYSDVQTIAVEVAHVSTPRGTTKAYACLYIAQAIAGLAGSAIERIAQVERDEQALVAGDDAWKGWMLPGPADSHCYVDEMPRPRQAEGTYTPAPADAWRPSRRGDTYGAPGGKPVQGVWFTTDYVVGLVVAEGVAVEAVAAALRGLDAVDHREVGVMTRGLAAAQAGLDSVPEVLVDYWNSRPEYLTEREWVRVRGSVTLLRVAEMLDAVARVVLLVPGSHHEVEYRSISGLDLRLWGAGWLMDAGRNVGTFGTPEEFLYDGPDDHPTGQTSRTYRAGIGPSLASLPVWDAAALALDALRWVA